MNKVLCVFGTRPEAIKMCPLIKILEKYENIEVVVCATGQHKEMLSQVLEIFCITPKYNLDVMQKNSTLVTISTGILGKITDIYIKEKPDLVLVHGDTTTAFIAALAAFYQKIPVGHVEAGLRSYNKYSPYPEEMNRILISKIAELHFAPTENNRENLINEGIKTDIYVTGNTVIDALQTTIRTNYMFHEEILNQIDYKKKKCILMTVHRRENWGKPIESIYRAVIDLLSKNDDIEVIYPVHLNPLIQECAKKFMANNTRVHLVQPLDLLDMHNLMRRCYLVMTDSGGIQEEAPSFNIPVLVLRSETERTEAVAAGAVLLVGTEINNIVETVNTLLYDEKKYKSIAQVENPYGDGHSAVRIAEIIKKWCNNR